MIGATTHRTNEARAWVVLVHGVGDHDPGAGARKLAQTLGQGRSGFRSTLFELRGTTYALQEPEDPELPTVAEVNWSDVRRPGRSWWGAAASILHNADCMLGLAQEWHSARPSRVLALYRWLVEALVPWIALQLIAAMLAASFGGWRGGLACILMAGVGAACTRVLRRSPVAFWAGVTWTVALVAMAVASAAGGSSTPEMMARASAVAYSAGACAGALVIPCVAARVMLRAESNMNAERRIARLFLAVLPLLILSAAGSLAITLALIVAARGEHFDRWSSAHLDALWFDLQFAELAFALAFIAVTALLVAVAVAYLVRREAPGAGSFVQDQIPRVCVCTLVLFSAAGAAIAVDACLGNLLGRSIAALWPWYELQRREGDIMSFYAVSVSRLVILGPLLLPSVLTGVKVLGDVVFYAAPSSMTDDLRGVLSRRLATLIEHAASKHGPVMVAAHSQGTMIAAETAPRVAASVRGVFLCGSPIGSLYRRFLGYPVDLPGRLRCVNAFRPDDPIAGHIEGIKNIESGWRGRGHGDYWLEPRIVPLILP